MSIAALTPWTALAAIRMGTVVASAQASDAEVKVAKPATKTLLAPTRSPSAPAVRMNDAKVIV